MYESKYGKALSLNRNRLSLFAKTNEVVKVNDIRLGDLVHTVLLRFYRDFFTDSENSSKLVATPYFN